MLTAAGLSAEGVKGAVRRAGLLSIYRSVFLVWLEDDDPGLAKTMAVLDRKLRNGETWMKRADAMCDRFMSIVARRRPFEETPQKDPDAPRDPQPKPEPEPDRNQGSGSFPGEQPSAG